MQHRTIVFVSKYPGATYKRTAPPGCGLKRHIRSIMSKDKAVLGSPLTHYYKI